VLAALVLLVMKVRGGSGAGVSDEERARALAEYERTRAALDREQPMQSDRVGKRRKSPPPLRAEKPAEDDEEKRVPRTPLGIPRRIPAAKQTFEGARVAPKVDTDDEDDETKKQMKEATRLYDKGNYPAALEEALKVLDENPRNIKMLRVAVSALCSTGEVEKAQRYLAGLPKRDQVQMRRRCRKWGVELE
jgi:hypothetical protein